MSTKKDLGLQVKHKCQPKNKYLKDYKKLVNQELRAYKERELLHTVSQFAILGILALLVIPTIANLVIVILK
jgi:hypothetical protein